MTRMTTVVGFNMPNYHDNAVAVIVDGRLVYASEEERYTRHKHSENEPPVNSMLHAFAHLKGIGIRPGDIDAFAINFDSRRFRLQNKIAGVVSASLKKSGAGGDVFGLASAYLKKGISLRDAPRRFLQGVYSTLGMSLPKGVRIVPVMHHLAHAASAHYFSGFRSCGVLVADGFGERESTTLWKAKNGDFELLDGVDVRDGSLGILYEAVGMLLGFNALEGPGKVMGLAPYGKKAANIASKFKAVLASKATGPFKFSASALDRRFAEVMYREAYAPFLRTLGNGMDLRWDRSGKINRNVANIAYSLQEFTEELMVDLAEKVKESTGSSRLAMSGGVALNAKSNMEIHYSDLFNDIFIFPAANDAGTPIGAAAYVYEHKLGKKMQNHRLSSIYLGDEHDDNEVRLAVEVSTLKAEYIGQDVSEIASLVNKRKTIAWFKGRAELGPRALGNRSIIANPCYANTLSILNGIKGREWWRPLAPSLLLNDASKYLHRPTHHQFMILMFKMTDRGKEHAPAACHVDGTARVQTVKREENREWYEVIKGFKELSGEGIVVNTSFNLAGEPIVETPAEALNSFKRSRLDAMYLQGWLLSKR